MDLDTAYINWAEADDVTGNTWHVAPTGITRDEVEAVLLDPRATVHHSYQHDSYLKFGSSADGRLIGVAFVIESDDPLVVYPVTAYYCEPENP